MSEPFRIEGADGRIIEIAAGEYYFNTKARARRMMRNSLSVHARQVYMCLELATMGFQQELAVIMQDGKKRNLIEADIVRQTGLIKQNVTRALVELEDAGLAKREVDDGGNFRRGHIRLYSWADPHPTRDTTKIKDVTARVTFPSWFPQTWDAFRPLIQRFKWGFKPGYCPAREEIEEGERIARSYQQAELDTARFLERCCAQAANKEERTERTERNGSGAPPPAAAPSPSSSSSSVAPEATTTTPAPEPDPVFAAMKEYAHSVDEDAVRQLRAACQAETDATDAEIAAAIHEKQHVIRLSKKPVGFMLTAVPKLCTRAWLAGRRARTSEDAQRERDRRVDRLRRYLGFVEDPRLDGHERALCMEQLELAAPDELAEARALLEAKP